MGFPRQEYRSGLPFPAPGDLPDEGIKLGSPALAGEFFITSPAYLEVPNKTIHTYKVLKMVSEHAIEVIVGRNFQFLFSSTSACLLGFWYSLYFFFENDITVYYFVTLFTIIISP